MARKSRQPGDPAFEQFDIEGCPGAVEICRICRADEDQRGRSSDARTAASRASSLAASVRGVLHTRKSLDEIAAAQLAAPFRPRQERSELAPRWGRWFQGDHLAREHAVALDQDRGPGQAAATRASPAVDARRDHRLPAEPSASGWADPRSPGPLRRDERRLGECATGPPASPRAAGRTGRWSPGRESSSSASARRTRDGSIAATPRQVGREAGTVPIQNLDQPLEVRREPGRSRIGRRDAPRSRAERTRPAGSSRGSPSAPPEPGSLAQHVVEPGRAIALDPPGQDLVFPDGRRRGEPLQLFQDHLDKRRALAPASPDERAGAAAENRRRPPGPPPGSRAAAPPRSPGASRPGFRARPTVPAPASRHRPRGRPSPLPTHRSSSSAASTGGDRIAGGQVGQADQGMSLQESPHDRIARLVVRRRRPRNAESIE